MSATLDHGRPPARSHMIGVLRKFVRRVVDVHLLFPLFTAAVLLIGWSAVLHTIAIEEASTRTAMLESTRELADTYEAQLGRNLVAIDQTLKTIQYAYMLNGVAALSQMRERGLLPPAMLFRVSIFDADGELVGATRTLSLINAEKAPWFAEQRNRSNDYPSPFVGKTADNRLSGAGEITFSRRLSNSAGAFAGVVAVTVDPEYFTSGYDLARMGSDGMLALLGTDGVVRAERRGDNASWGALVVSDEPLRARSDAAHSPIRDHWNRDVPRVVSVRELHGFPLLAVAGLGEDEQMTDFLRHRKTYLEAAAMGSVLLVILAYFVSRASLQLTLSRERARRAQQTFYAASEGSLDAFFILQGRASAGGHARVFLIQESNRRAAELLGIARERLVGQPLCSAFKGSESDAMLDEFAQVERTGVTAEYEWRHERPDGTSIWLQRQAVRVDGGVVAIMRDVSTRKHTELRRAEQSRVLEMIATGDSLDSILNYLIRVLEAQITGSVGAILLCDEDSRRFDIGAGPGLPEAYFRSAAFSVVGAESGPTGRAIHGQSPVLISDVKRDPLMSAMFWDAGLSACGACWSWPILSHRGGAIGAITLYLDHAREPTTLETESIATSTRIAAIAIERRRAESRIQHMANHDSLTGLPNRALLTDRLERFLQTPHCERRGLSVLFVDLDNFKLINDSLGHRAGDELLRTIAQRMVESVRASDTVVRLGGDEFVVVLIDETPAREPGMVVVETLRTAILRPVVLDGQTYRVTSSMGLASYPGDGTDTETLLMNADAAMYRAKELGRNNFQTYAAELNSKARARLRLREQMREALDNDEFHLLYQPQIALKTNALVGVEALLRWNHPLDGAMSPADFIPVAEENGLIIEIGDWVLRTACRQAQQWLAADLGPGTMSVNVSPRQFADSDWVGRVEHALAESGLPPSMLELEITEGAIMQDLDGAIVTMMKLQTMGVRLAIDDFGTGYSSLSALKHFPIRRLKVDQSFVRGLPDSEDDCAIARAVILLGQQLHLTVIAEGVETEAQLDFLRRCDCDEIQGYRFSRPLQAHEVEQLARGPVVWPEIG